MFYNRTQSGADRVIKKPKPIQYFRGTISIFNYKKYAYLSFQKKYFLDVFIIFVHFKVAIARDWIKIYKNKTLTVFGTFVIPMIILFKKSTNISDT